MTQTTCKGENGGKQPASQLLTEEEFRRRVVESLEDIQKEMRGKPLVCLERRPKEHKAKASAELRMAKGRGRPKTRPEGPVGAPIELSAATGPTCKVPPADLPMEVGPQ